MAKSKKGGKKKTGGPPVDLYEADDFELVPDEEKHAGQRYDVSMMHLNVGVVRSSGSRERNNAEVCIYV